MSIPHEWKVILTGNYKGDVAPMFGMEINHKHFNILSSQRLWDDKLPLLTGTKGGSEISTYPHKVKLWTGITSFPFRIGALERQSFSLSSTKWFIVSLLATNTCAPLGLRTVLPALSAPKWTLYHTSFIDVLRSKPSGILSMSGARSTWTFHCRICANTKFYSESETGNTTVK